MNKEKKIDIRQLDDLDYLMGVFDKTREGNLRFRVPGEEFVSQAGPIPKIIQLPELLEASRQVTSGADNLEALKALLDAGSGSLGVARPKASVTYNEKLLLAKFPHPGDEWNVMAWEKTALELANNCGIDVPQNKLIKIGQSSVLVMERFDRHNSMLDGYRNGYISGMTLLEANDGDAHDYGELAEAMLLFCENSNLEIKKLILRILFLIAINNTDDHLRNWGFLRNNSTWELSPAFDVNPNPDLNKQRVTGVLGHYETDAATGAHKLGLEFGLKQDEIEELIAKVTTAVSNWQTIAFQNGCTAEEIALMKPVFESALSRLKI